MKNFFVWFTLFAAIVAANAQAPPQIPLTGNIGVPGSVAILGGVTVQMPANANYTLTAAQWANKTLVITSAVALTATRSIIAPLNKGQEYNIENSTTGGQSITIIGATGTGITIATGASATVFTDGTNYIQGTGGGGALPSTLNGVVYANGASPPTVATSTQTNASLGFSNGLNVNGDSIAGSTGTTSTGVGNIALYNGFAQLLRSPIGGPFDELGSSGDQAADGNLKWIYRAINPQGSGIDPVFIEELGTNDAIQYLGDANKQIIFQRVMLGSLVNAALPQANKKFAQTCTLAGGFAASAATPFSTMAVVSTTNSSTVSCIINAPKASDTLYVVYQIKDTNPGTFTVSLDGTPQNDPFNGTTTWNAFGDGGALIHTSNNANSAYAAARFTGVSSGNHTILFTVTSATSASNIVEIEYVGAAPVAAAGNPLVYSVSPNQQNTGSAGSPFVAAYQGFIQTIDTNLTSDGLNVAYIDTSNALLNSPLCGNGNQAAMFANCYGSGGADNVHPNNTGHSVMANTILAVIPASLQRGVTTWNTTQPLQNFIAANTPNFAPLIGPQDFADINPNNISGDATHWGPGIKFNCANGNCSWMGYQSASGLTIASPSGVSGLQFCPSGGGGLMPSLPPVATTCQFQWIANGQFNFNSGSTTINGFTIQGGQVSGGTNVMWNVPGTMKWTSNLSGVYSTVVPTNVSTNNDSPVMYLRGGVWNGITSSGGFDGPGWQSKAINPTPAGQAGQSYMTLQNGSSSVSGLDIRNSVLINHLGTYDAATATIATANVTTLNINGVGFTVARGTSAAIGGGALIAGACANSGAISVPVSVGAGSVITASPAGGSPGQAFTWRAFATGSGTINIEVCATIAGTPTSMAYNWLAVP